MADRIKATKDEIWRKKQAIQAEESQRKEWAETIPEVEATIASLDPEDPALDMWKETVATARLTIQAHDESLAKLRNALASLEAELPQTTQAAAPKFDPEKHPLLRKAVEKPEPEQVVVFSAGDMVEAQWTDRAWYKAKVTSVLGSASAPKYLVRFVDYDETMTVDSKAVRQLPGKRKRDPESAVGPAPAVPVNANPHVISGPASMNPNAQIARSNAVTEDDPAVKKKAKIANKGQLNKRLNNWQDFQNKTAKKIPKRESMFRTSTEAGSRVGFTGSGKGMTETRKRRRYDHKADFEFDDEEP